MRQVSCSEKLTMKPNQQGNLGATSAKGLSEMLVYKGKYIEFQIRKMTFRLQFFPLKFPVFMITL